MTTTTESPAPSGRREGRLTILIFLTLFALGVGAVFYNAFADRDYERLDAAAHDAVAGACDRAIDGFEALGSLPDVITREQLAQRLDAENAILVSMTSTIDGITTSNDEGQAALDGWAEDWRAVVAGREQYTVDVRDTSIERPDLALPVAKDGAIKPVTSRMEEYAQLHEVAQCTPKSLAVETVDGPRAYGIDRN